MENLDLYLLEPPSIATTTWYHCLRLVLAILAVVIPVHMTLLERFAMPLALINNRLLAPVHEFWADPNRRSRFRWAILLLCLLLALDQLRGRRFLVLEDFRCLCIACLLSHYMGRSLLLMD